MSRGTWELLKKSKSFYIRTYRLAGTWALVSMLLNFMLLLAISYVHFTEPERNYYATSGITPPVQLTAFKTPNYSNTPLLEPDPVNDDETRIIPQ